MDWSQGLRAQTTGSEAPLCATARSEPFVLRLRQISYCWSLVLKHIVSLEGRHMRKKTFNVIIMHGRSTAWRVVKEFVEEAGYTARILMTEPGGGTIFDRLRSVIWDEIHCAVIVLSGDDLGTRSRKRARQNVVFELGYCYGAFDSLPDDATYGAEDAIIVLEERGVEPFSDIGGLRTVRFSKGNIRNEKAEFLKHLNHAFAKADDYY